MKQKRYCYDIEVYPNFFSITFLDIDTQERDVFVIYKSRNDGEKLDEFLNRDILLYGYNNISYDSAILEHVLENYTSLSVLGDVFDLSMKIISDDSPYGYRNRKTGNDYIFKQIDLMKIMAFDKLGVSLKQIAINLRWHRIQDLPYPPTHIVEPDEVPIILDYNLNDTLITHELYKAMLDIVVLREKLSELYAVDLTSASDSKIANVLLEDFYKKQNANIDTIRGLRTVRYQLILSECFGKNIEFLTNKLNRIKNEMGNTVVREKNDFKFDKKIEFGCTEYRLGVGGLHSVDTEGIFETNDEYIIRDADVASYYPNIMIVNKIIPAHLQEDFIEVLKQITAERLSAKKKDKVKADGLKITINSIFGKLGSNTFWLYDPKALLSVTVSGQLYLLMLIESLVLAGIQVISANTDGIVCKVPRNMEGYYNQICKWWQDKTGFSLEYTDYEFYARTDVNNYLTKKADGHVKTKGRYLTEKDTEEWEKSFLKKGYKYPIVSRALFQYFMDKKPIEETIRESQDVLDFCISQKTGKDFVLEYHVNDSITKLQKNNRFYISISGGKLIKRNKEKDTTIGLYVSQNATILNNYDKNIPFSSYDIDYPFYIEEANKYVLPIEESRKVVKDFSFVDEPPDYTPLDKLSPNEEAIRLKLDGVKNLSGRVITALVKLDDTFPSGSVETVDGGVGVFKTCDFFELMVYAEENSLMSKKFGDLIKINYFSRFGKNKKLLTFFLEFTSGKLKYKSTLSQKSKDKRLPELKKLWDSLPDESITVKEQIDSEIQILGRIDSHFNVNARYAYVLGISTKYSPRLQLYSLGTGTQVEIKMRKLYYDIQPIKEGDIIYTQTFEKKPAVKRLDDGTFVEDPTKPDVYWLTSYKILRDYSELVERQK
jgi:hypothetical protein